jgi:hypothetical protein
MRENTAQMKSVDPHFYPCNVPLCTAGEKKLHTKKKHKHTHGQWLGGAKHWKQPHQFTRDGVARDWEEWSGKQGFYSGAPHFAMQKLCWLSGTMIELRRKRINIKLFSWTAHSITRSSTRTDYITASERWEALTMEKCGTQFTKKNVSSDDSAKQRRSPL